jgi:hypothetical protein
VSFKLTGAAVLVCVLRALGWNLTAWMTDFNSERQAEILGILRSDPRACAILNRKLVSFWDNDEAGVAVLPLAHYMTTDMPRVAELGGYGIRVHPGRSVPWSGGVLSTRCQ